MSKKKYTLLDRGRWCVAIGEAISISENNSVNDTAEMLLHGVIPINLMSEQEVVAELKGICNKEEQTLAPYTLGELVKEAEKRLNIEYSPDEIE